MTTLTEAADALAQCPICERRIGSHHADGCKHWGQVLPSECPGLIESAIADVLAKRELDGKLAAAREEMREACKRAYRALVDRSRSAGWTLEEFDAELDAIPLPFEPLRIRIEELKADLATAAKVTEELVDGLSEEVRKRQVAEVELATLREAWADENSRADRGVELLERVVVICTGGGQAGAALLDEVEAWLSALKAAKK